jgi:hypothetical protein
MVKYNLNYLCVRIYIYISCCTLFPFKMIFKCESYQKFVSASLTLKNVRIKIESVRKGRTTHKIGAVTVLKF